MVTTAWIYFATMDKITLGTKFCVRRT